MQFPFLSSQVNGLKLTHEQAMGQATNWWNGAHFLTSIICKKFSSSNLILKFLQSTLILFSYQRKMLAN
jgi:hypothetical protein